MPSRARRLRPARGMRRLRRRAAERDRGPRGLPGGHPARGPGRPHHPEFRPRRSPGWRRSTSPWPTSPPTRGGRHPRHRVPRGARAPCGNEKLDAAPAQAPPAAQRVQLHVGHRVREPLGPQHGNDPGAGARRPDSVVARRGNFRRLGAGGSSSKSQPFGPHRGATADKRSVEMVLRTWRRVAHADRALRGGTAGRFHGRAHRDAASMRRPTPPPRFSAPSASASSIAARHVGPSSLLVAAAAAPSVGGATAAFTVITLLPVIATALHGPRPARARHRRSGGVLRAPGRALGGERYPGRGCPAGV